MLKKSIKIPMPILLSACLLIVLIAGGAFVLGVWGGNSRCNGCHAMADELAFRRRYEGVSCILCFRQANYLINTGQWIPPELPTPSETEMLIQVVTTGDTFEEMVSFFREESPWQCDSCLYRSAETTWEQNDFEVDGWKFTTNRLP